MSLVLAAFLALATQAAETANATVVPENIEATIPEKIPAPEADDNGPTVNIHTGDNGDVVEEYRQAGQLTMVKVTPLHGPSYYLIDSDGDGFLDGKDGDGVVAPVYWKIYEWN